MLSHFAHGEVLVGGQLEVEEALHGGAHLVHGGLVVLVPQHSKEHLPAVWSAKGPSRDLLQEVSRFTFKGCVKA